MKTINTFLKSIERELNVTIFAIGMVWLLGLYLPVTFMIFA